ncbi:hypothetical protein CCMA1212_008972 [Trichoderma ghanense]|uniref:Uncharacterized protein n=1 Tax=Trichoderma ghanense TaxID=65468 RepID=A0ABY2GVN0_9HYPO
MVVQCRISLQARDSRERHSSYSNSSSLHSPYELAAISNGRRWGAPRVSSAPEPGAGSVEFLPQVHKRAAGKHGANDAGGSRPWAVVGRAERLRPSSLGGWCAEACNGSCQREHQSIDSRQSAPSPSGPAAAGRALGPARFAAKDDVMHPDTYVQ